MSLKALKKEEIETLSTKDIASMIIAEGKRKLNTADLFKKVIKLSGLPENTFENKIADFYTSLSTDKRFILLENGKWDLRNNHTSDKVLKVSDDEEDEDEEEQELELDSKQEPIEEDNYDDNDEEDYSEDTNEELKDLVIIDEDELELEE